MLNLTVNCRNTPSIQKEINKIVGIELCKEDSREITYSTIQFLKGMEYSVIFLTDIQTYNKPDLMYVAMSRPRSMLVILKHNQQKNTEKN